MKDILKTKNGITLVALVVTIIILLILSGITIATLTGENGLFTRAKEAKLEAKRSQIIEWLNLKLIEEQSEDIKRTSEEIIIETRENVIKSQDELKQIGKDISIGEVLKETIKEDPKKVNTYFEIIVDGDIYKVEMSGAKLVGISNELLPKINLESITNTTNKITVNVKVERNEGGKIEYYIKCEDEENYKLKETGTNETYTYLNLEQNKKYNIKIVATAKNGRTAELLADATTGNVTDLTSGNTTFEYSTKEWTNGNVTVTAKTTEIGYTLQTSKDGKTWNNTATQTFIENGTVYARLWDGTNYGGAYSGTVTNIDKLKPNVFTPTSTSTTNKITIAAKTTDQTETTTNGASGIEGYRFSKDEGKTWTSYQASGTYTFNDMLKDINGSTYTITIEAKDKAQNVTSATIQASTSKNNNYYINEANKLLCALQKSEGTREYYKSFKGGSIAALIYARGGAFLSGSQQFGEADWIYPLLVSTDANAVTYYCDDILNDTGSNNDSGHLTSSGMLEYKGVKYYYSSYGYWMYDINSHTTSIKELNTATTPYRSEKIIDTQKNAVLDLIKTYLGE